MGDYQLVILDDVTYAVNCGWIDVRDVLRVRTDRLADLINPHLDGATIFHLLEGPSESLPSLTPQTSRR